MRKNRARSKGRMQQPRCQETRSFCEGCQQIVKTAHWSVVAASCEPYTNIMILPVRSYLWSGHVYWAFCRTGLATIAKGTPGQKGQKTRCCWVVWATDWAFTVSLFVHLVWFTEAIRIHKHSFRLSLSPIVLHTAGIVNLTSSQLATCLRM